MPDPIHSLPVARIGFIVLPVIVFFGPLARMAMTTIG